MNMIKAIEPTDAPKLAYLKRQAELKIQKIYELQRQIQRTAAYNVTHRDIVNEMAGLYSELDMLEDTIMSVEAAIGQTKRGMTVESDKELIDAVITGMYQKKEGA